MACTVQMDLQGLGMNIFAPKTCKPFGQKINIARNNHSGHFFFNRLAVSDFINLIKGLSAVWRKKNG